MSAVAASDALLRGTIVIAEDDAATRMLLCRVLRRENFRVIAVSDGQLACEAVRRERPDVVLLDWRMPVMDGRAALEELKAHKETRGIPIVMLTSRSQVDERIIALEAGVQDFLSKPFDPRELVACIEQQLRWQQGLAVDADAAFREQREALLAASERRYRLLAEAMPHMVWIADPEGRIVYVNCAWQEYTGVPFEQLVHEGWGAALHPDDRLSSLRAWSRSIETGQPYEMQYRFRRASDGMYRWHLTRATPTSDTNGRIVDWVGSCADIHDYKLAGETRAVLDTIGSIVSIRTAQGFVDYTSPYWSQYTGGHADSGLGAGWRAFVHPDDLAVVDAAHARSTAGATAPDYEMRIRGRDGMYRWFLSRSTMLPNAPGAACRWLDTTTDVDDLKHTQSALERSESRYRALTDSMPQMVWVIDAGARFEYVNHRWSEYTGFSLAEMHERGWDAIVDASSLASIAPLHGALPPVEYIREARFRRGDGTYRWHVLRAVPFFDELGGSHRWIATATDIDESKLAAAKLATTAAKLEHLAHYDPLTGLPNRMLLLDRLAQAMALAQRARTGVLVMYLDLDRFKIINDTFGHAAGDRVLHVTAKRIASALRIGDTASRIGGDEFVLAVATSEGAEDAGRVAARIHAAIGQPIELDAATVTVGASIGISLFPSDGVEGSDLIEKADGAMYAAKQSGQNAFRFFGEQSHSSIVATLDFESELREAVAAGQIVVYYQPIVSLQSRRILGAEALVRWQHPRRGVLEPADFLPFAEEHRLIEAIGAVVLDVVCRQIAQLGPAAGLDAEFSIAMNVSARQFAEPAFVENVAAALRLHRAEPRRLCIEIAERVLTGDAAAVKPALNGLRALGVRLAVDDFGTGYTSLAAIKTFPLQTLKIDRSFVAAVVTDSADQAIAKTIITLAHSLGLNVIAEGVETTAQIDALRDFGSDAFQGYIAGRPMNAANFCAFIEPHLVGALSVGA